MEINEILASLGVDLTNPEARKGAMEAIDAILASRIDLSGLGGGGGAMGKPTEPVEVEIDPDLIQPSIKQQSSKKSDDDDIEVEDEEKILDQIKHNDPEDPQEFKDPTESDEPTELEEPTEPEESTEHGEPNNSKESGQDSNPESEPENDTSQGSESGKSKEDPNGSEEPEESGESKEPDESEDDENDWLDDTVKQAAHGSEEDKKTESRKRKRERVLRAAQATLEKARAAGAAKELIAELESAAAALEALLEAVNKNIADLSDEEFNQMVNRVFDAIEALNPGDLTYSSEEDRQAKVTEIQTDLSSSRTQAELSAEDAAVIRAEHQAIKAREDEAEKYRPKSRKSFQGFQAFMDSLQRGIALQVSYSRARDNTWSAISRRNSGAGVLRQGQRLKELPNTKIPVIDFYFDQSGSWDESDLAVGNQAVEALAKLKEDGKINVNVYYFSNHVYENAQDARAEGGTRAWNEIIKNIVATDANNVVIMTDADMEDWWSGPTALKHTVPGFVWYLWRNGENAPRLPRDLQGRGGTMQYSC